MKRFLILAAFIASPAFAQSAPYNAPDQEIWQAMAKAIDDIPMSADAHDKVRQIFSNVQTETGRRAAVAKAAEASRKQVDAAKNSMGEIQNNTGIITQGNEPAPEK